MIQIHQNFENPVGIKLNLFVLFQKSDTGNTPGPNEPVKVKISGDGALISRNSNYVILSFSILHKGEEVMSSKGNENKLTKFQCKLKIYISLMRMVHYPTNDNYKFNEILILKISNWYKEMAHSKITKVI